jgi:hypothetical protein
MKETAKIFGVYLLIMGVFIVYSCNKMELPEPKAVDLGQLSMSTDIKSIIQNGNLVSVEFKTTLGAKYSVQIIPFGKDQPVKVEGFTATDSITKKVFNLTGLPKQDYDLIFIDINGKEVKHPIIIK